MMKPQRSEKYRKHRASKYEFPTRVVKAGVKGSLHVGAKDAKTAIERRLRRPLREGTVARHTRSEWVFCEPILGSER
jgi:hypothetical protein